MSEAVNKPCPGCGVPIYKGQARCAVCRKKISALRKKAWKEYRAMGSPGDWYSFFAAYSGEKMPEFPEIMRKR